MARANTRTWLALDDWARIMSYNLWEFNGISAFPCQIGSNCANVWFQHPEQYDTVSREDLAIAISEAERLISDYVGYNLMPDWDTETVNTPRFYQPEVTSLFTTNWKPKSVKTSKGWVKGLGGRVKILLEKDSPIVLVDKDGDGFFETVQITVDSDIPQNEVRVYYPDANGDDAWEIRPIRFVDNNGTVQFPLYLTVRQEFIEPNCVNGLDANDDIFLATVDVYHVTNDQMVFNKLIYQRYCSTGCNPSYIESCGQVIDNKLGYIAYNPRMLCDPISKRIEPDKVELNYYSGWVSTNQNISGLDPYWQLPIAYLASALLDKEPKNCCGGNESQLVTQWREDLSKKLTTEFVLNNPFGMTNKGAYFAYRRARDRKLQ